MEVKETERLKLIYLIEKLSPDLQEQVIDFINFLIEKRLKQKKMDMEYDFKIKEISKFAGALDKLWIEPLTYQKNLRKEWE